MWGGCEEYLRREVWGGCEEGGVWGGCEEYDEGDSVCKDKSWRYMVWEVRVGVRKRTMNTTKL